MLLSQIVPVISLERANALLRERLGKAKRVVRCTRSAATAQWRDDLLDMPCPHCVEQARLVCIEEMKP
jgi:hypothetical protein